MRRTERRSDHETLPFGALASPNASWGFASCTQPARPAQIVPPRELPDTLSLAACPFADLLGMIENNHLRRAFGIAIRRMPWIAYRHRNHATAISRSSFWRARYATCQRSAASEWNGYRQTLAGLPCSAASCACWIMPAMDTIGSLTLPPSLPRRGSRCGRSEPAAPECVGESHHQWQQGQHAHACRFRHPP